MVKKFTCQCRRYEFNPWVGKILWRRKWQPIPILLPGKSHGQRSLAGYHPRGCKIGHVLCPILQPSCHYHHHCFLIWCVKFSHFWIFDTCQSHLSPCLHIPTMTLKPLSLSLTPPLPASLAHRQRYLRAPLTLRFNTQILGWSFRER